MAARLEPLYAEIRARVVRELPAMSGETMRS